MNDQLPAARRRARGALLIPILTVALALSATTAGAASLPPVTISPLPGTPDAPPHTQISFLGAPASQIDDVSVRGSASGVHKGHLASYASAAGASFIPSETS